MGEPKVPKRGRSQPHSNGAGGKGKLSRDPRLRRCGAGVSAVAAVAAWAAAAAAFEGTLPALREGSAAAGATAAAMVEVARAVGMAAAVTAVARAVEERAVARLKLVSFMDISINVEKIKTAVRLCPDIVKLDLSLFNCSSYYQNIMQDDSLLGHGIRRRDNMLGDAERTWVDILFDFINLKDLEAVYLDDSRAFRYNIR